MESRRKHGGDTLDGFAESAGGGLSMENIMPQTLGKRLSWARRRKGLTMEQLAKMAGVSLPSISKYEGDKQSPTLYTAQCLADVLCISLDWLACRSDKVEV